MKKTILSLLLMGLTVFTFAHGPNNGNKKNYPPQRGPYATPPQRNLQRPQQNMTRPQSNTARPQRNAEDVKPVTVSGNIIVANGYPAIKSGDVTYFVGGIRRLFGLVDGLKEGSQVTIEGRAFAAREEKTMFLSPSKLTFNGKTYDNLEPPRPAMQNRTAPGAQPNRPDSRRR